MSANQRTDWDWDEVFIIIVWKTADWALDIHVVREDWGGSGQIFIEYWSIYHSCISSYRVSNVHLTFKPYLQNTNSDNVVEIRMEVIDPISMMILSSFWEWIVHWSESLQLIKIIINSCFTVDKNWTLITIFKR